MRKHGKDIETFDDPFKQKVHDMWQEARGFVENDNLDKYLSDTNSPDLRAMERDDDLTVEDALLIGGYMVLSKLHSEVHRGQVDEIVKIVMDGSKSLGEALHDMGVELPEDMISEIDKVLKMVQRDRKKR